jgi:hypothetical protein
MCLIVFAIASRLVVGSTEGAKLQPFGILVADAGYRRLLDPGRTPLPAAGGFWLPALEQHRPGAWTFVLAMLALFVLGELFRLFGLIVLPWSPLIHDPAAWWSAGVVLGGYLVTFLLAHVGLSQQWFALNASSVGVALAVATIAVAFPPHPSRHALAFTTVSLGAGLAIATQAPRLGELLNHPGAQPGLTARLLPYVAAVAGLVLWVAGLALLPRPHRHPRALGPVALIGILLVAAVLPASTAWLRSGRVTPITTNPGALVTADEQRAALWINQNTPTNAVVVGNVFCRPVRYRPTCDHSSVWASALTGRVFLLDGWAYTPESLAQYDGSLWWAFLPSPWPDRLRLSLDLIQQPQRSTVCEAVQRWHAGWALVDAEATAVSPALSSYAELRYVSGAVSVYRFRDATSLGCAPPPAP